MSLQLFFFLLESTLHRGTEARTTNLVGNLDNPLQPPVAAKRQSEPTPPSLDRYVSLDSPSET